MSSVLQNKSAPVYSTAADMDGADPLSSFRDLFHVPLAASGRDSIYFCGNSLGLQPKAAKDAVLQELEDWQRYGVEGYLRARNPWLPADEFMMAASAVLVGARRDEVTVMNTLTANLHLMMVSFYRPTAKRYKILIEPNAFPSDRYAVDSQIKFHGFDPADAVIEGEPLEMLAKHGESIAIILIGGVNYYTGRFYDIAALTKAAHEKGCIAGFDFAHAVGNVPLLLHDWGVDFACWCSYKYLNGGPGGVAGCFVHQKHGHDFKGPRFAGWWGHDKETRFKMGPEFKAIAGAEGWQLSNLPILSRAVLRSSLEIFDRAGMESLRRKSVLLTGYLEYLLDGLHSKAFTILTPRDPAQRGCQLSLAMRENGKQVHESLVKAGVVCDWREPDCIRVAPVPLYNRFQDVRDFVDIFAALIR